MTTPTLYFRNKSTGREYRVVKLDKENKKITLRGEHAEFVEDYDKAKFESLGYVLVKKEENADA